MRRTVILGVALIVLLALAVQAGPGEGRHPRHRAGGPGGPAGFGELAIVMHQLELTDEQVQRVRELVHESLAGNREQRQGAHAARQAVAQTMWSSEASEAAVLDAVRRAAHEAEQAALVRFELVQQIKQVLTDEQVQQVQKLLAELPEPRMRRPIGRAGH